MKKTNTKLISLVGSGNVATHLALALQACGYAFSQVYSPTFGHAQLLANRLGAEPVCRVDMVRPDADVYLLAVTDDALFDLALDLRLRDALVLHTSGATPMSVLRDISRRHGVVWSPQTFVRDIAMDYRHLPLCIEGSSPAVEQQIADLFDPVSDCVYRLSFDQRRWVHLAAVMVSNFVNAVNAEAQQLMQALGLDFDMLRPLAEQTLRKMDYGDLRAQQTGPAIRHDDRTIAAQRRLLADNPRLLALYDMMTDLIQNPTP